MATVKRNTELKKVKFGTTDMMVTQVCAGTMTWGSFNADESQAHAQLDKLWQLGVNFIDTAELYPVAWNYGALTERWIGNWLTKRIADGTVERSKLYIATKVNPGGIPIEEEFKQPLKPGESRTWVYTTGDLPADWAKNIEKYYQGEGNVDLSSGTTLVVFWEVWCPHCRREVPELKETYEKLLWRMPPSIDWSRLGEYEAEDNTSGAQTLACVAGVCEVVDLN